MRPGDLANILAAGNNDSDSTQSDQLVNGWIQGIGQGCTDEDNLSA